MKNTPGMVRPLMVAICLFTASWSPALINPNFTPIHIVEQSSDIMCVRLGAPAADGRVEVAIESVLQGKQAGKSLQFDLTTALREADSKLIQKMIPGAGAPAIFFIGKQGMQTGEEELDGVSEDDVRAFLHLDGLWWLFYQAQDGSWELDKKDEHMQATWAGATDMLKLCVLYIIADKDADVPVSTGATWGGNTKAARIDGVVYRAQAVELAKGSFLLYVAAAGGDRLLECGDSREFKDVTAGRGLKANSMVSAWADFDGDTRLDLLSWDGKTMTLHSQQPDGTFLSSPAKASGLEGAGCLGLSVVDSDVPGKPAVVVNTDKGLSLWVPGVPARSVSPLAVDPAHVRERGKAGPCLAADLDGDSIADLLQMFEKGSIFYRGSGRGAFVAGVDCKPELGSGAADAFLGDYDADGQIDLFTVSENPRGLWNNRGNGQFEQAIQYAGEIAYISQPRAIGGMTGDINNDGRQDIFIYYSDKPPQLFFNRGFRSFGHSHMLDLAEKRMLPASTEGQQAGCLADFDADGGQDMAIVLKNGEVWVFFRDTEDAPSYATQVTVPLGGSFAGPVSVSGRAGDRSLGAWPVMAGTAPAYIGQLDAGPCTLQWQFPGEKVQRKEVIVEDGQLPFAVKPVAAP